MQGYTGLSLGKGIQLIDYQSTFLSVLRCWIVTTCSDGLQQTVECGQKAFHSQYSSSQPAPSVLLHVVAAPKAWTTLIKAPA